MNIRKWSKPGTDEIRYYFDMRFGPAPFLSHENNYLLSGRWIGCDDNGLAHIYTKTSGGFGRCRSEDGDWLDTAFFGSDPITFTGWEKIYNSCLTKSGNFSVAKYMKR